MTSRLDSRLLGLVLAAALGCTAPDRHSPAPDAPQVFQVTLTAATPAGLPSCTKAIQGTTAATESPAGIWTCQGTWVAIPCTNGLAGAVAYASATKALWACTAGQWTSVVLPPGPQGQPGLKGDTGAPGTNGKPGAMSIVVQTVDPPGANCASGGTRIASGVDLDGDQQIDDGEPVQVSYVCNGAAGPAGASGAPGALLTVTPEPPGANCASGGQRIGYGVDTNGNGVLDDGESTVSYVCNGGAPSTGGGGDDGSGDGGYHGTGTEPLTVSCTSPVRNSFREIIPGTLIVLSGKVAGGSGAAMVKVNGVAAPVAADGAFTASLTTRYGLNHAELEAADEAGQVTRELCSFLVAKTFVDEGAPLDWSISLSLKQSAIDDGDRVGPINSLADVLATAVNSDGLITAIDAGMPSPLKDGCDVEVLGVCVVRSKVVYLGSSLPGPNTVTASLVPGGVSVRARFEDPRVELRVSGEVALAPFDTTGNATVDFIDVGVTFDLGLEGGRPRATIRPDSVGVLAGSVDTDFSGVDGQILDMVANLAQTNMRSSLTSSLQNAVIANFDAMVGPLVSSLDISRLQTEFAVPRFDGTGDTPIAFGAAFSFVNVDPTGLMVSLASRFSVPPAHIRQPHRVPLPSDDARLNPTGTEPVAVAVYVGVLQQALQANWRGGGLDGTIAAPDGTTVAFTTTLPPVVFVNTDGTAGIDLGIDTNVSLAGRPIPIHALAAARAHAAVALADDDLIFSALTLDEVHVVIPETRLKPADASALTTTLRALLAQMAERSLNDALPRLPVPAFTVPEALGVYGLPAGKQLGLTSATLTLGERHAVLRGGFGVR